MKFWILTLLGTAAFAQSTFSKTEEDNHICIRVQLDGVACEFQLNALIPKGFRPGECGSDYTFEHCTETQTTEANTGLSDLTDSCESAVVEVFCTEQTEPEPTGEDITIRVIEEDVHVCLQVQLNTGTCSEAYTNLLDEGGEEGECPSEYDADHCTSDHEIMAEYDLSSLQEKCETADIDIRCMLGTIGNPVANLSPCASHSDCTNVEDSNGDVIGDTYCYDNGIFENGVANGERNCAGDAMQCCECADNDSYDNNHENCPAVSDCANTCGGSGNPVAGLTRCSSHSDCTNVRFEGADIGDTYCYDMGIYTDGEANGNTRCAEDAKMCCECEDDDSFDDNHENCPAVSDCATTCEGVCAEATGDAFDNALESSNTDGCNTLLGLPQDTDVTHEQFCACINSLSDNDKTTFSGTDYDCKKGPEEPYTISGYFAECAVDDSTQNTEDPNPQNTEDPDTETPEPKTNSSNQLSIILGFFISYALLV